MLGKTFTRRGLAALSGTSGDEIEPLVTSLLRKEIFYLETDPRSPERGQYGFLQALVQHVAYETLSRRERRSRHLAAAAFLAHDSGMDLSEISEVIAAHFLDAYEADEKAPDADDVKASARGWFVRAAERAAALAAAAEAQRAYERAASLADEDVERAGLLHRAGEAARMASDVGAAERHLADAIAVFEHAGRAHEEAQASSTLADILFATGRIEDAVERLERSLAVFETGEDEAAEATVLAQLGRFYFFEDKRERAFDCIERALEIGEQMRLPEVVSQALNTKGLLLQHRPHESIALMRGALELAREQSLPLGRAYINLSYLLWISGAPNHDTEEVVREGLSYARRRGDREGERSFVAQLAGGLYEEGRWDELEQLTAELPEEASRVGNAVGFQLPSALALIAYHRGEPSSAAALMRDWAALEPSADVLLESCRIWAQALTATAEGRNDDVIAPARSRIESPANTADLEAHLDLAGEATSDLDSARMLGELLDLAETADVPKPPSTVAQRARLRAKVAALRGDDTPEFGRAVALLRESDSRVQLAMTLTEQAEWLVAQGRSEEAASGLEEARQIFEPLRAKPWLERLERAEHVLDAARVPA